jgi:hypothetical protein
MAMVDDQKNLYEAMLSELHTKRSYYRRCASDTDQAISGLIKVMQASGMVVPTQETTALAVIHPSPQVQPQDRRSAVSTHPISHRFGSMSVRWAILLLLDEAKSDMSTSEIVEALEAGDIRAKSKAVSFNNNVSAVLSDMKSPRAEVEVTDGRYKITDKGRSAINHIKFTRGIA